MPNLKFQSWMKYNVFYIVEDYVLDWSRYLPSDIYPVAFSWTKIKWNSYKAPLWMNLSKTSLLRPYGYNTHGPKSTRIKIPLIGFECFFINDENRLYVHPTKVQ